MGVLEEILFIGPAPGDVADLCSLVEVAQPDELKNLAAVPFVAFNFKQRSLVVFRGWEMLKRTGAHEILAEARGGSDIHRLLPMVP